MNLHKALKEILALKGVEIIINAQVINYLLDYNAFKEVPATKLILRDIISFGFAEKLLLLNPSNTDWLICFSKYQQEFIDICGYQEGLTNYVFESIAYALGLQDATPQFNKLPNKRGETSYTPNGNNLGKLDIKEIMELARKGDFDAVMYCAKYKIDPFNSDSNFFFDYSKILIGDWFYEDGSYSHEKSDLKKCVGVVFSLNTSAIEKAEGWTHGLIVAIKDVKEREWGDCDELPYPHTHYDSKDMENLEKAPNMFKDYQTEFMLRDENITAFKAARRCKLVLPEGRTSGWFLPSITQLKQIASNLPAKILTKISMSGGFIHWSSSQSNANEACYIYISNWNDDVSFSFGTNRKIFPQKIRPIAAF